MPLLLFVVGGMLLLSGVVPVRPMTDLPAPGLAKAVILGMFAFSGMETPLAASGEVANGHRTVPRALFAAMGFVLVLYVAIQLVAQCLLGASLVGQAAAGRRGGADRAGGPRGPGGRGRALDAGLDRQRHPGAPRILFAFARDGLLPPVLGRAHPGTHAPDVAIAIHAAIAAALAVSGSFTGLVVASTLNTAGLYFLACGALPVAAAAGMIAMLLLVCVAPRDEILGLVAVLAGSVVLYAAGRGLAGWTRSQGA